MMQDMPNARRTVFCGIIFLGLLLAGVDATRLLGKDDEKKDTTTPEKRTVFKVSVDSVMLSVTATGKDGKPVTDLTRDDFKVYDNNTSQNITTFGMESFAPPEVERQDASEAKPPSGEQPSARPRMISIVIDDLTMESVLDLARTVDAVREFVKNDMGRMDQVSIVSASRSVQIPFTDDRQRLLGVLASVPDRLNKSMNYYFDAAGGFMSELDAWHLSSHNTDITQPALNSDGSFRSSSGEELASLWAQRITDEGQFRTQELLYTVSRNIRVLRHFAGDRTLILFSDGFLSERGSREAYQLQGLIDLAVKSGIVLNTVSTRGVELRRYTNSPEKGAWEELGALAQHSSLSKVADETGGLFFNGNSLSMPLRTIARRNSSYYVLTYTMPPDKPRDDYHNVRLEVTRPGVRLNYRKGYSSPRGEVSFESARHEDILAAISSSGNMKEIPVALSYNYYHSPSPSPEPAPAPDAAAYTLSLIANVDIRDMKFTQEQGRRVNQVSIVWVVYDAVDNYIRGLERAMEFELLEDNYKELRERGLSSKVDFKLPIGRYKVKAIVREENQGKMGSVAKMVEIP
jgi:VWFA-related protein